MTVTQEEISKFKEKFRKMGMAGFSINGLPEDESIKRLIEEKWSFTYVFVMEPYTRSKNLLYRLFQISKDNPSVPLGYYGQPGFSFECYDGNAFKVAPMLLQLMMRSKYIAKKSYRDDVISFKKMDELNDKCFTLSEESKKTLDVYGVSLVKWPKEG